MPGGNKIDENYNQLLIFIFLWNCIGKILYRIIEMHENPFALYAPQIRSRSIKFSYAFMLALDRICARARSVFSKHRCCSMADTYEFKHMWIFTIWSCPNWYYNRHMIFIIPHVRFNFWLPLTWVYFQHKNPISHLTAPTYHDYQPFFLLDSIRLYDQRFKIFHLVKHNHVNPHLLLYTKTCSLLRLFSKNGTSNWLDYQINLHSGFPI